MNKYIIPICDIFNEQIWNKICVANSIADCQDKIMLKYSEKFDENFLDWQDFIDDMNHKYDYIIGDIIDIETL